LRCGAGKRHQHPPLLSFVLCFCFCFWLMLQHRYRHGCRGVQRGPFQSPCYKGEPGDAKDVRRRTEIISVKDSHTRIKPLALASGHGRYITVTPERTLVSVG
jgi:hypothetical protein